MALNAANLPLPNVKWPGVVAVESFNYEVNHGASPNIAAITTYPQKAIPAEFGDLSWTDGSGESLVIRGCRAKKQIGTYSHAGQTWVLHILDPRWQWMNDFGGLSGITGHYNEKDTRGELVPWTIRSPEELIVLCLKQLGVTNYVVRAPQGYTQKDGARLNKILFLGERWKPSGTNMEFVWNHTPPAEALTQLCQQYGLRIVYQPFSNRVLVVPPGEGKSLPDGAMEVSAPNITAPETPVALGAVGAEMRIQVRLPLEAVAKEWHGWPVDPLAVSYAPAVNLSPGKPQKSKVTWFVPTPPPDPLGISLVFTDVDGRKVRIDVESTVSTSISDLYLDLIQRLAEYANVTALFAFSVSGNDLLINSSQPNAPFELILFRPGEPELPMVIYGTSTTQVATGPAGKASWAYSHPPVFPEVRPTERLSHMEARRLASESVFRWFRVKLANPTIGAKTGKSETSTSVGAPVPPPPPVTGAASTKASARSETSTSFQGSDTVGSQIVPSKPDPKKAGLWIPWYSEQYGPITRREQLIILNTKVEQVTPKPRIGVGVQQDQGNILPLDVSSGVLAESYAGVSRDQEATVTGSVFYKIGSVNWYPFQATTVGAGNVSLAVADQNTDPKSRVFTSFNIITAVNGEQLIGFNEAIFKYVIDSVGRATKDFPELTLETSVMVKHPISNVPIHWEEFLPLVSGMSPVEWHRNEELKVGIVGIYDANNNLMGWKYADGDMAYTRQAARYFLRSKAARYYVKGGESRQYPGIIAIEPDGLIQQVSWSIGAGGHTTVASVNTEHSPFWPEYPRRVRAELLAPNKLAADANERERQYLDKLNPIIRWAPQ